MVELVALVVGGQREVVEAARGLAADGGGQALVELDADGAGDVALRAFDVGLQVLVVG